MRIGKRIGRAVRVAVGAAVGLATGAVLVAVAVTPMGKDLRRRAAKRVDAALASLRQRFERAQPVDVVVEPIDPTIEHEHALEHGPEGRASAAAHAKKPHVAPAGLGETMRSAAARRSQRHV